MGRVPADRVWIVEYLDYSRGWLPCPCAQDGDLDAYETRKNARIEMLAVKKRCPVHSFRIRVRKYVREGNQT